MGKLGDKNVVYVLHEYGDLRHYLGLSCLCDSVGVKIVFHEFGVTRQLAKGLFKFKPKLVLRAFRNFAFLLWLLIFARRPQIVVIGVAPFDFRVAVLRYIAAAHNAFWHTSWPYWTSLTSSLVPKPVVWNWSIAHWENFLHQISGIFFVTRSAQLAFHEAFRQLPATSYVVHHSFDEALFYPGTYEDHSSIFRVVYAGRICASKGFDKVLDIVSQSPKSIRFYFAGQISSDIELGSSNYDNVHFVGTLSRVELAKLFRSCQVFLSPSRNSKGWTEAFGISLIEAMACGVIPIATLQPGPIEILSDRFSDLLFTEDDYVTGAMAMIERFQQDKSLFIGYQKGIINLAQAYASKNIAERWRPVLEQIPPRRSI